MTEEQLAEQYAENIELDTKWNNPRQVIEQAFLAGAEFGYNKAKEELEKEIEVKDTQIKELQEQKMYWKESSFDWRHKYFKLGKEKKLIAKDKKLREAKEIIERLIKATYGEGWNYSLQVKVEAEKFLKESE